MLTLILIPCLSIRFIVTIFNSQEKINSKFSLLLLNSLLLIFMILLRFKILPYIESLINCSQFQKEQILYPKKSFRYAFVVDNFFNFILLRISIYQQYQRSNI